MKQVQAWFAEHMPSVRTPIISLSATYQHDDPKTWEEIKAKGDAAIVGVGHCSTCAPGVATRYWDLQLVQNYVYPWATFGKEPMATWLKAAPDEMIRIFPENEINVVVVGGETNGYWRIMGAKYRKAISIDDWR